MREYDEYQTSLRYKHGTQAFWILTALLWINSLLKIYEVHWGETSYIETLMLWSIAMGYFILKNTYHGAFFDKIENPKTKSISSFLFGIFYIFLTLSGPGNIIADGKIGFGALQLAVGLIWIVVPVVYFIRVLVEKKSAESSK